LLHVRSGLWSFFWSPPFAIFSLHPYSASLRVFNSLIPSKSSLLSWQSSLHVNIESLCSRPSPPFVFRDPLHSFIFSPLTLGNQNRCPTSLTFYPIFADVFFPSPWAPISPGLSPPPHLISSRAPPSPPPVSLEYPPHPITPCPYLLG